MKAGRLVTCRFTSLSCWWMKSLTVLVFILGEGCLPCTGLGHPSRPGAGSCHRLKDAGLLWQEQEPEQLDKHIHKPVVLRADVLQCWRVPFGHLHFLDHGGVCKVIPFCSAVQWVSPVCAVQLVVFLWLLVVFLHRIPGIEDSVPAHSHGA